MSSLASQPPVKGNPASAQPMRGLSERAQKLLKPKSAHYRCLAIEPPGSGIERATRIGPQR